MSGFLIRLAIGAFGLWMADLLLSGISIDGTSTLLLAAFLLGVVNAFVRPIFVILTLPLTLLTLGLFLLVINAAMLGLVAAMLPGFHVAGFGSGDMRDRLRLVASPDGHDGSLTVHQDALLHLGRLAKGSKIAHPIGAGRHAWLQVARGSVRANGESLAAGDGAALSGELALELEAVEPSQVLVFDLA